MVLSIEGEMPKKPLEQYLTAQSQEFILVVALSVAVSLPLKIEEPRLPLYHVEAQCSLPKCYIITAFPLLCMTV